MAPRAKNTRIDRINGGLWGIHMALGLGALLVAPLTFVGELRPLLPAVLVASLFTNQLWALMHEGIHNRLFTQRRRSDLGARALGIIYGAPFGMLRAGHLMHHQHNRTEKERVEVTPRPPGRTDQLAYFFGLFGGLYLSQVVVCLFFFLPEAWIRRLAYALLAEGSFQHRVITRSLRSDLRRIRVDQALIVALYAASFLLYGAQWPLLVALIALRGFLVSFLDYVYHYGSPLDDPQHGYNLRLPRPLGLFLLHFNLHGVHHRRPGASWLDLPARFQADGLRYDAGYLSQAVAQLGGVTGPREA